MLKNNLDYFRSLDNDKLTHYHEEANHIWFYLTIKGPSQEEFADWHTKSQSFWQERLECIEHIMNERNLIKI